MVVCVTQVPGYCKRTVMERRHSCTFDRLCTSFMCLLLFQCVIEGFFWGMSAVKVGERSEEGAMLVTYRLYSSS